jgi:DNA-directed RNA polymerase subunit RPC12/RpoP
MTNYKCFKCGKIAKQENLQKRFVCIDCGGKIFFKPRKIVKKIKTD